MSKSNNLFMVFSEQGLKKWPIIFNSLLICKRIIGVIFFDWLDFINFICLSKSRIHAPYADWHHSGWSIPLRDSLETTPLSKINFYDLKKMILKTFQKSLPLIPFHIHQFPLLQIRKILSTFHLKDIYMDA